MSTRLAPTARYAALLMPLGLFAMQPSHAKAQTCSFTITDIDFGDIATAQVDVTGTMTANCSGWSGIATRLMICPNFGQGTGGSVSGNPRRALNGANIVNYQIYSNSGRTTVWGSYLWAFAQRPPKLSVILAAGAGTGSWTMYARYPAGTAPPLGTYTSSFGAGQVDIRYAADSAGTAVCAAGTGTPGLPQPSFNVRARRGTACTVSTGNIDFGSKGILATNNDAQTSLTVNCTGPYTISLGNGGTGTGPTNRKMVKGAESVTYGLYSDAARTLPWGSTAGQTIAGTGAGAAQSYNVYGRVPAQTTPSAGEYTDTVVVTITY